MPRDSRKSVIQVLESAAYGHLPPELIEGENVPDVSIYHDLIDQGYLMGTVLSDGRRPYFIEGCHITSKGREYLEKLRKDTSSPNNSWKLKLKFGWIGFLIGILAGILGSIKWIHKYGLPEWLQ